MSSSAEDRLQLCRQALRSIAVEESGGALIELALALALLGLPLLLGTIYTGVLLFDDIEISNAAHTAALYGMQSSTYASDSNGMTTAAQAEAPDLGAALNVTPAIFYACSTAISGTQYSTQAAATTGCASSHALEFVQVSVSYAATPFAHIPGMQQTVTMSSVSVMEVEE